MGRVSPSKVLNQDNVLLTLGSMSPQMMSTGSEVLGSGDPVSERSRASWRSSFQYLRKGPE